MTDGATEQPAKKATTRRRTAKKAAPAAGTASGGAHKAEPSRRVLQRQIMPIDRDFDVFALYVDAEDATLDADKYEIGGSKAAKDLNNAAIRQATSTGRGIGPDQIRVQELLRRVNRWEDTSNKELVMALNPSVEGEATALYISRLLRPMGVKLSKIAYGLPMGGSIEYADRGTLGRALENRTEC